jgi:uncharacterized protein (TIGR02271 family)
MAQRVTAIFRSRDDAERAANALVDLGADRSHISMIARGEEGRVDTTTPAAGHPDTELVEPAREVGDAGAPLTTSDGGDAAAGAAVGAVVGLAAGLLALTVPGIGLVLAAGPLAGAIIGGAFLGGVYGGLRDIGIEEAHARGYEKRIRGGDVLLTALVPNLAPQPVRDVLNEYNAEDVTFAQDTSAIATAAATTTADTRAAMTAPAAGPLTPAAAPSATDATMGDTTTTVDTAASRTLSAPGEIRVPVTEETAQVRKDKRETGAVGIRKEVDTETQHISEPVTRTKVEVERQPVAADAAYQPDPNAATLREGETVRVPVVQEELTVEKTPRVTEEVVVRAKPETEQIERDVQLRRERVEVDEEGDAEIEDADDLAARRSP